MGAHTLTYRAVAHYFDGTPTRIELTVDGEPAVLIVDDLALPNHLPRNERATAIYRRDCLAPHPDNLPYIEGPAVLVDC